MPNIANQTSKQNGWLERIFHLREKQADIKTEFLAGLTTSVTIAYIILVNPNILASVGIPKEAAIAATIYATCFATLMMGLWANLPIAVAPGLGLSAFLAYYVIDMLHLPWRVALGAVFFSGIFFLILTISKIFKAIIQAVPVNLKFAIGVGIGLFIAFIGLKNASIVISNQNTLVTIGQIIRVEPALSFLGLILITTLTALRIRGAMLFSILIITFISMAFGISPCPKKISDIVSFHLPSLQATFGQLDIIGAWHYGIFSIIFTFTIVELFDNIGTILGVMQKSGLVKEDGGLDKFNHALASNAVGTMASAVFGTGTVTAYVESAAGVACGGKTGLTACVVAVLFFLSIIFAPLISLIPGFAVAPALVFVGALMMSEITKVKFDDITEAVPAFLTIIIMPLTFSIANGLGFGFISYVLIKTLSGRFKEINWVMWIISIAFMINFYMRLK